MIQVGDKVWINVLNKYNYRGIVTEIVDNIATIQVPVHYSNQGYITTYKDIEFLTKVPETLKELEEFKKLKKGDIF